VLCALPEARRESELVRFVAPLVARVAQGVAMGPAASAALLADFTIVAVIFKELDPAVRKTGTGGGGGDNDDVIAVEDSAGVVTLHPVSELVAQEEAAAAVGEHPVLLVLRALWPSLLALLTTWAEQENVTAAVCDLLGHALRTLEADFAEFLPALVLLSFLLAFKKVF
jgi:hypothetical protein